MNLSVFGQDIAFLSGDLDLNGKVNVGSSTYLKFGPDGRLYVIERYGNIFALTIEKTGGNSYTVTSSETISLVKNIPNHNDDGSLNSGQKNRETTALLVKGTVTNPVIYVSSSDPRIGGPSGDKNLDTNSGTITRLTWNGNSWEAVDLVRGLPRSEENHATHGLEYAVVQNKPYLLVCQGGHTNAGSPSKNFAWSSEYALSGAVLAIDLNQINSIQIKTDPISGRKYIYDLPTLDDPTRPNVNGISDPNNPGYNGIDQNDPFGGNDGLNQAKLVPGGPVQMFSPGYRNTYDLVFTSKGAVYVTDNGANGGWGGFPENEGPAGNANNNYRVGEPGSTSADNGEGGVDNKDHLTLVTQNIQNYTFGSFYGGHPNPVRSNPQGAGLFTRGAHSSDPGDSNGNGYNDDWFRTQILNPGNADFSTQSLPVDWPPVPVSMADTRQGDMRLPSKANPDGVNDDNILVWPNNTNGIDEYTSNAFNGAMKGDLIAGKNGGLIHRVKLKADGTVATFYGSWITGLGGNVLGIFCSGDNDPFPGTIWLATFNGKIKVLTPDEAVVCILPGDPGYDPNADNDNDGFTNKDEEDNGTNMCSGGSQPNDFDGDKISDLNDLDDDGDGIVDSDDPFQLGVPFDLPVVNELFSDQLDLKGYQGLGLTGLMNSGAPNPNYLDWVDKPAESNSDVDDIYGGAVGGMTIYHTTGDASTNNQEKGYHYGVNVDQSTGKFKVAARMLSPFYNHSNTESQGIYIGTGFQDDYVKLVISGSEIFVAGENNGQNLTGLPSATLPSFQDNLELYFDIDPQMGSIQASYTYDQITSPTPIGVPFQAQGAVLNAIQNADTPLAVGMIGTADQDDGFASNWDYLNVTNSSLSAPEGVVFRVNAGGPTTLATDGGPDWLSDIGASLALNQFEVNTGNSYVSPANTWAAGIESDIKARTPFSIFDTERWDSGAAPEMKYTFNVSEAGEYIVRLFFSSGWDGASIPGQRIFTVAVDGNNPAELKDLDIVELVGHKTATVIEIPVNTPDELIDIEFTHYVQNPLICGIEIKRKPEPKPIEKVVFRVNAGGPGFAAPDGGLEWTSDLSATLAANNFTVNTGSAYKGTANTWDNAVDEEIKNTTPFDIFNTERWDAGGAPKMKYTFKLPQPGEFTVRLFMRDAWSGTSSPGSRIFNVSVDGNFPPSLQTIDLTASFGHKVATVFETIVQTDDDIIEIEFTHVVQNPLICGIEILSGNDGVETNTPPIAEAGLNQILVDNDNNEFEVVALDATPSSDADGEIVSYIWFENGEQIASGMSTNLSLPIGVHNITLTVSDDKGAKDTDVVTITIEEGTAQISTQTIKLEAECASFIGGNFAIINDNAASNGKSLAAQGTLRYLNEVPDDPTSTFNFDFTVAETGTYSIFVRAICPSASRDSYWVRIDGGSWIKFNEIASSNTYITAQLHDSDQSKSLVIANLSQGAHNIEFAFREPEVVLDYVTITSEEQAPDNIIGSKGENCETPLLRTASSGFDIQVYPNPAREEAVLRIKGEMRGRIRVELTDLTGKNLAFYDLEKSTQEISLKLALQHLSGGIYMIDIKGEELHEVLRLVNLK